MTQRRSDQYQDNHTHYRPHDFTGRAARSSELRRARRREQVSATGTRRLVVQLYRRSG